MPLLGQSFSTKHNIELLEKIRRKDANVPVIISTGYAAEKIRERFEEPGIECYLIKPEAVKRLVSVARNCLSQRRPLYELVKTRLSRQLLRHPRRIDNNVAGALARLCIESGMAEPLQIVELDRDHSLVLVSNSSYLSQLQSIKLIPARDWKRQPCQK